MKGKAEIAKTAPHQRRRMGGRRNRRCTDINPQNLYPCILNIKRSKYTNHGSLRQPPGFGEARKRRPSEIACRRLAGAAPVRQDHACQSVGGRVQKYLLQSGESSVIWRCQTIDRGPSAYSEQGGFAIDDLAPGNYLDRGRELAPLGSR